MQVAAFYRVLFLLILTVLLLICKHMLHRLVYLHLIKFYTIAFAEFDLKSDLKYFVRVLLAIKSQYGSLDDGSRFHVIAHLIRETVNCGKSMLAFSVMTRDDSSESGSNLKETGSIQNLIQKDRVQAVVCLKCYFDDLGLV